jgi:hypothetical protein
MTSKRLRYSAHHYLLDDLERQVGAFVEHYNHVHYHESVDNPDPGSAQPRQSWPSVNASNATLWQTVACSIDCRPLKL